MSGPDVGAGSESGFGVYWRLGGGFGLGVVVVEHNKH